MGVEGWETTSEGRKVAYSNGQEQRARGTKVGSLVFAAEGLCMCTCVWKERSFQGMRSVCGGLRICLTWLGKRETFPSWEDQRVSLFSVALNQEELK